MLATCPTPGGGGGGGMNSLAPHWSSCRWIHVISAPWFCWGINEVAVAACDQGDDRLLQIFLLCNVQLEP